MINNDDFVKRLQKVIEYYGESASSFAEKVGVQRSSISHILSGRNKPSLDFVLKILQSYPEVELYWLLNGKGVFPNESAPISGQTSLPIIERENHPKETPKPPLPFNEKSNSKDIERIVIFYTDGTFKEYHKE
ncbi:helix-turn-helix transcriptional regulator [Mangrovimonas sp. YM274]|uniref:helix-turn-helix domain-containing protein n=1 Tax=Mangrovimonas sp. YM274 TaxID=3070660 RepID=UPI0027DD0D81|nr:helix-turn-helix transcriptional regulator [Mangrovimonas sp. YM274]WMI67251.1 helix-turn-helix transcriptional regulator [Mangrovimonas sp. YM274]